MLDSVATELINKLNFLEDEDQETPPTMGTNPFDEPDDHLHDLNDLNPFGDPDEEGKFNTVSKWQSISRFKVLGSDLVIKYC